jgi:polyhydroxyalkanoate synthesis regulator phasin
MRKQKTVAAVAMTAALAGGALIGATLGSPLASGAQDSTTTTTAPSSGSENGTAESAEHDGPGRGFGRGLSLEVAAETLGLTTEELRTQLQDGKSLAQVAEAQGVDKQELIDALVAAGEERLDEAKAALPERIAEAVEATHTPGDHGGPGFGRGPGGRGANLEVAAEALGVTVEDLRTALRDGKTIAEVAEEKGVDKQKVIDALVAEAETKIAEAVTDGKITQEQADERLEKLTERITSFVDEGGPRAHRDGEGD